MEESFEVGVRITAILSSHVYVVDPPSSRRVCAPSGAAGRSIFKVLLNTRLLIGDWGTECGRGSEVLRLEVLLSRWRWMRRRWWQKWGCGVVRCSPWCAGWRDSSHPLAFGRSGLGRCRLAGAGWACRPAAASAASVPRSEPSSRRWRSLVSPTPAEERQLFFNAF